MILACDFNESSAAPEPMQLALMAFSIVAPLVVFWVLPKRMAIGQELRFALATALRPLARLASLRSGNGDEARSWGARLRAAARGMTERAWPAGAVGEVVREERLFARARAVGLGAAAVPIAGVAVLAAVMLVSQSDPYPITLKFLASSVIPALAAAFIAWVGAFAAALWAQSLAFGDGPLSRSGARRALGGGLVGAGYGAVTGACAGLLSMALFVPAMSLLTGDPPHARDLYPMFALYSLACALLGAAVGVITLAPLAALTRRDTVRL